MGIVSKKTQLKQSVEQLRGRGGGSLQRISDDRGGFLSMSWKASGGGEGGRGREEIISKE